MTLNEIRTQMATLKVRTSQLQKKEKKYLTNIKRIDSKSNGINALISDDKETIESCKKFISANENSKDPKIIARVAERRNQQAEAEKSLKSLQEDLRKSENEKQQLEQHPDYVNLSKEISEAKKGINEICDILEQDPTINTQLQLAVKFRFSKEINIQNKEKVKYEEANKNLRDALKSGSNYDDLKSFVDAIKESKAERARADKDINADSNAAKKKFFEARKNLQNEIKNRFGIEIEPMDVDYILSQIDSGKIDDNFALPSATVKISKIDAIISKLGKSRDKMLEELESKKSASVLENDQEIEANNLRIEELKKDITRFDSQKSDILEEKQRNEEAIIDSGVEIEEKNTEVEVLTTQIEELDKEIAEKTAEAGDMSEIDELIKAEEALRENHIISEEAVTDLKDENSSISIVFKEFSDVDLQVRKAFENCKTDNSPEAMEALKQAISEYKSVSETLKNMSGYDQESWQNYLKENLNKRIDSGETLDSAYYHQENENFKKMKLDKNISQNEGVLEAYNEIGNKLEEIDLCQNAILNGTFDMPVEELFMDKDLGYHKLVNDMQGRNTSGKSSFYDMIKSPKLIKPSLWNRFKGLVKKGVTKVTKSNKFELPKNRKSLLEAYEKANSPEAMEAKKSLSNIRELENKKDVAEKEKAHLNEDIERLTKRKTSLETANTYAEGDLETLENNRKVAEEMIAELETANEELKAQNAKNPKTTSKIEQTDDLEFVTREDNILSNSLDRMQLNKKIEDDLER